MNDLMFVFLMGIAIMLFLFWWSDHTRAGRRFLYGDEKEDKKK